MNLIQTQYNISANVETGYFGENTKGSNVFITFGFDMWNTDISKINDISKKTKHIIDNIDHCLIVDYNHEELIQYSERYILLKKLTNIFFDIYKIMVYFIRTQYKELNPVHIIIKIGDESILFPYSVLSKEEIKIITDDIIK